jgi:hypothetical protein
MINMFLHLIEVLLQISLFYQQEIMKLFMKIGKKNIIFGNQFLAKMAIFGLCHVMVQIIF